MKRRTLKKILLTSLSVFALLVVVLCVHIYIVTRPKAPTEKSRVMARIDFKQPINQDDAVKITAWLYQQKGVDHVLVNPKSEIAIFTFYPVKVNANDIVKNLTSSLNYKAERYIPTEADLAKSCPVSPNSFSYKFYKTIKQIF
jgi:hypothetical protein